MCPFILFLMYQDSFDPGGASICCSGSPTSSMVYAGVSADEDGGGVD